MGSQKTKTVKVGDKFELSDKQEMWIDDLSGVSLRAPSKVIISRPKDSDYRTRFEWYSKFRFNKNINDKLHENDEGNTWFEVTKGMNLARIKVAIAKGILVPKGKSKHSKYIEKKNKSLFRTDSVTGHVVYDGPNKSIWNLLQDNVNKRLVETIEKIKSTELLEIMLEMEQKGWNHIGSSRMDIVNKIEDQLKDHAIGISSIKEEEVKQEALHAENPNVDPNDLAERLNKK